MAALNRNFRSSVTNEDWKMCSQWIADLKVYPLEHALFKCTDLFGFANMLRDGTILCDVVNRISPGAISKQKVSRVPKSLHFTLININLAREAMISLGLHPNDVLGERDLASMENFYKVLLSLSKLSHLTKSTATGAKPWPPVDRILKDDEQIYGRLDEMLVPLTPAPGNSTAPGLPNRISSPGAASSFAFNNDTFDGRGEDDDVYQNLGLDTEEESIYDRIVVDQTAKPQAKTKREYAIKELVSTEETYVESLKSIVHDVMQPSRIFMSAEPWLHLFQFLDQLYSLHKNFLEELNIQVESALQPGNNNKLNLLGIWQRRKRDFLVYTKFVVNKPIAENAFDRMMENENSRKQFLALCSRVQKMRSFSFKEYLFVPIQRVLKYHLLLEAIEKNTTDESEKKNMRGSIAVINDVQRCINEAQRDGEMLDRIQMIESIIADMTLPPNTKLSDYGRMHIDGEMLVRSHADTRPAVRFVFLFDFMLIICKMQPNKPQYRLRDCCYVTNLDVRHVDPASNFKPKDKYKHAFEILKRTSVEPDASIDNVYTMATRTERERRNWMEALETARTNLRPQGSMNGNHHFTYKSFEEIYECDVCGKFMAGIMFQGYQCVMDYCCMVSHGKCLEKVPTEPDRRPEAVVACRNYDGTNPEHPRKLPTIRFVAGDIVSLWIRWPSEWGFGEIREERGFFPMSAVSEQRQQQTPPRVPDLIQFSKNVLAYPWFVGEMAKETASQLLKSLRSGTFLVRQSLATSVKPGEYAISLKYDPRETDPEHPRDSADHIRHIRINRYDIQFSLSQEPPYFSSVVELVMYYQRNSLVAVFHELCTPLLFPYVPEQQNALFEARVLFDFQPTLLSELGLMNNEHIFVLATAVPGRSEGEWWRGRNTAGQVGIFPASYVKRI